MLRANDPADLPLEARGPSLLAATEGQWFDRKSIRVSAQDLADDLVAFANAEGGTVAVGLSEGAVEGTDAHQSRCNALRQAAVDFTVPPVAARVRLVPCINAGGAPDHVLLIDVDPSDGVVHANRRDVVFLRIGDEKHRLTFSQRQELTFDKGHGAFEFRPTIAPLDAARGAELDRYLGALGARGAADLLRARGLARGVELTVAGYLLFAEHPQALFPEAHVRVLRYRGRERGAGARQRLEVDERVEGSLPVQILRARELVGQLQPERRALGREGRFVDRGLVPEDAWLEALVNAVTHRSYSVAGDHVRVEVFDDRIEVTSPGRFPGVVALDRPTRVARYARNPRIARVLSDLGFGQELGEGIRRMHEEMELAGLRGPDYRQTPSDVRVELSGEPADRRIDAALPAETREIVSALRAAERLSTGELAEVMGLARPGALRRLSRLREAGVVAWVGKSAKDPRAYWTLPPT